MKSQAETPKNAGTLMVDLCKIQQASGAKRTQLVAKAKRDWAGHIWSNPTLRDWAREAWKAGLR
jgi:hypothetical protein